MLKMDSPWSTEKLELIHQAVLDILSRTGIRVEHETISQEILRRSGFQFVNGRVVIAPERVEGWVRASRERRAETAAPPNEIRYGFSDRAAYIVDSDCRSIHPMSRGEVVKWTKMLDVLADRGVYAQSGSTAGVPMDVPIPLQPLEQYMIGAKCSRWGGKTSQLTDIATAEIVREMDSVYGRTFSLSVWCPSPLILGGTELDIFWHFRDSVRSGVVGSMPSMGVNGPCDLFGIYALSAAECIGGAVILSELLPHVPMGICAHPQPSDMRTGAMMFGTPEFELLDLMHRDFHAFYGVPWTFKLLHSSAPLPGAHAQLERSRSALLGALSGYHDFLPLGQLALDEVWSPAQTLLDLDIVGESLRIAHGATTAEGLEPAQLAAVIGETVVAGGSFLQHDTTAANYAQQYYESNCISHFTLSQWREKGQPDLALEAQSQAEALVAQHAYEPPRDIWKELQRIYAKANDRLQP